MNTPPADHLDDADDQSLSGLEGDEPYMRLPIDPSEPMADWLAII